MKREDALTDPKELVRLELKNSVHRLLQPRRRI